MSICTGITLVENLSPGTDLLSVSIDNGAQTAYWIFDQSKAMAYLNQEVIVDYRQDVYKGQLATFINTFVLPTTVQTLDKSDNFKLFCDVEDNQSNLSFAEIADGEYRAGCIVFCIKCEYKTSPSSQWMELLIRDRTMHTATLRLFDYANKSADFTGQYVNTELARSKYGFTAEFINPTSGEVVPNPEIAIAKQFITNYFSDDTHALTYMTNTNILSFLEQAIDYEVGYGLVRLAMELSMLQNMYNLTKDFDLQSIAHALLASRGYLVKESILSSVVNNVILACKVSWPDAKKVCTMLDENLTEHYDEYFIYKSIKDTVNTILERKKGTKF